MFRRRSHRPKHGPAVLKMRLMDGPTVTVTPRARGEPRVHLVLQLFNMTCSGALTEDEARRLAQALLDGIAQSKALTAENPP